jgi:hypothetical protein
MALLPRLGNGSTAENRSGIIFQMILEDHGIPGIINAFKRSAERSDFRSRAE